MPRLDLGFQFIPLAVQLTQVGGSPRDQRTQGVGEAVLSAFPDPWNLFGNRTDALRNHEPELCEQPTDRMGLKRCAP